MQLAGKNRRLNMKEVLDADQSALLMDLWRRRHKLNTTEIGLMYSIVQRCLQQFNPPELQLLGETRQELTAQFIYCKVLRLQDRDGAGAEDLLDDDDRHSAPSSSYALCAYFRRYLIDCTRASSFRRKVSIDEQMPDSLLQESDESDELQNHLLEHGLTPEQVLAAAKDFIDGLDEPERILLCESFGRETKGGLSGVAAKHSVTSYHYRAGRLGLVHKRQGLTCDYAKTMLGSWIEKTLGIPIHQENMSVILSVFKILGVQASYA
jgi:hypothetical protein